jgi:hypothetical protein
MTSSPPPEHQGMHGGRLGRILEGIVPAENPAAAIYGVLTIGALLTAEAGLHEKYIDTVGSAVIAVCLYWLAHGYATMVGWGIEGGERMSVGSLGRALLHDSSIVSGAAVPVLVLLICWLVGADQSTAVTADLWSILACLVVFELLAGLRTSATRGQLVIGVGVALLMGAGILALRVILH